MASINLEIALNIMWALLSAAMLGMLIHEASRRRLQRKDLLVAVAVVAIICFLFPVISITDDLNSAPLLGERARGIDWNAHHAYAALSFIAINVHNPESAPHAVSSFIGHSHLSETGTYSLNRRPPPALV